MHYEINRTKIVYNSAGSGNEKSVGIGWNLSKHESHQITFSNSNTFQLFKIGPWDPGFRLNLGDGS